MTHSRSTKWIWITLVILAALIAGVGSWTAVSRLSHGPHAIMVDGNPIVSVKSRNIAKSVLNEVKLGRFKEPHSEPVRFTQHVTIRKSPVNMELSVMPDAIDILREAVTVEVKSFAITADGAPVVALPSREIAEEALRLVKRHYENKLGTLDTQSSFKEKIFIDEQFIDAQKFCSTPEDAATMLTSISEKPLMHIVQRGDRAVKVVKQYGITIGDLQKMNLHTNLEQITEGNRLLVRRPKMPVTVISKAKVIKTVTITPPPEARKYGRAGTGTRKMQVLAIYENGVPISEEIISQVTTWDKPTRTFTKRSSKPVSTVSQTSITSQNSSSQPSSDQ